MIGATPLVLSLVAAKAKRWTGYNNRKIFKHEPEGDAAGTTVWIAKELRKVALDGDAVCSGENDSGYGGVGVFMFSVVRTSSSCLKVYQKR